MKQNKESRGRKIFCIAICLLFILLFAGCGGEDFEDGPNEYGFVRTVTGGMDVMFRSAYRLNETEFHKDNVTVEVFCGQVDNVIEVEDRPELVFRLYFADEQAFSPWNAEKAYLMKEIRYIDYYSEAYFMGGERRKDKVRYTFAHSEVLRVPPELFTLSQGEIFFGFCYYSKRNDRFPYRWFLPINYRLDGDTVTLSVPEH